MDQPGLEDSAFLPKKLPLGKTYEKWWWNRRYANILLMSTGVMFCSTAMFTASAISNNVISYMKRYGFQDGDGYKAFAIMSASQLGMSFFMPFVIGAIGGKWSTIIGGCSHLLYIGSFMFHSRMLLFFMSFLFGIGGACYWVGVGVVLAANTDPKTADKSTATFWILFNSANIWGNIFVAVKFRGVDIIDDNIRQTTFSILLASIVAGVIFFSFIRQSAAEEAVVTNLPTSEVLIASTTKIDDETSKSVSINKSYKKMSTSNVISRLYTRLQPTISLAASPLILICLGIFGFTGINGSLIIAIIPTAVGFNKHFGHCQKSLMGISGMCIGVSEISGGLLLMCIMGTRYVKRAYVFIFGTILASGAIVLSVLNSPLDATIHESSEPSILFGTGSSSIPIVIVCAILFGFGDAAVSITMYALISDVFGHAHDHSQKETTTENMEKLTKIIPSLNYDSKGKDVELFPMHVDPTIPTVVKLQHEQATATANTILKAVQALVSVCLMVLSAYLWFHWYIVIVLPLSLWASASFFIIDRNYRGGKYKNLFRA